MVVHWKRNIFRVPQGNIGKQFVDELARLYAAFVDGSDMCHLLKEIEDIIRMNLLPSLTGRPPLNDIERDLLSLPAWLGGIGIVNHRNATTIFTHP